MTIAIVPFSVLVILSNFVLENVEGQSARGGDSYTVFQALQTLTTAVESLQAKIESQTIKLSNFEAKVEMQVNNLETKVDAQAKSLTTSEAESKMHKSLLNNLLVTSAAMEANLLNIFEEKFSVLANVVNNLMAEDQKQVTSLNNLEAKADTQAALLNNLNANVEMQATSLSNLEAASKLHQNSINHLQSTAAEQTSLLNNLEANADMQATLLTILQAQSHVQATSLNNLVAEVEWHEPVPLFKTNRTIIAYEGDNVEIWCPIRGTPLPEIKWARENSTLESDRVTIENNGKVLRIQTAQLIDEGTYVCVAANGVGTPATQFVRLLVYGKFLQCNGVIESDKGNLEVEASGTSCLSIIKLQNTTGFHLQFDPLMTKPIVVIPEPNHSNSNAKFIRIYGSKNVPYEFAGKTLAIVIPPRPERTSLNWTGLAAKNSETISSTKYVSDLEGTLEWKTTSDGTDKIFWAFNFELNGELNWTLNTAFTEQDQESSCDKVSFGILKVRQDGNVSEIQKTCNGSSERSIQLESSSKVLVLLHIKSVEAAKSNLQVTWNYYDEPLKKLSEGIIAGTVPNGAVVIRFNDSQTKLSSSKDVDGLAFDWNSRRVYWLEDDVGLMRTSWDHSQPEVLLSDTSSTLIGLAIEPISGNIYYGNQSSKVIRVCNNDATRCSSISNSSDFSSIQDIAIHWSKGFLFWSIWKQKIVRANLDGSNAITILERKVTRIDVDEHEDRLYWGSPEGIGSCDLNGQDIRMVPNLSTYVQDVVIDGENVYYAAFLSKSINITSKLGTNSRLVANFTSNIYQLALFGTQDPNQPPNPCENSQCTHLCTLITPRSYRCLCPDNQELNPNGKTCKL